HARSCGLPYETLPFIRFAEQLKRSERVTGVSLDTKHFRDHLQLLAGFAKHFKTHTTADLRQLSWQVYECAFRTNVLSGAFGDDVRTARLVPLRFNFERGEVAWSGTIVGFNWSGHLDASYLPQRILSYKKAQRLERV